MLFAPLIMLLATIFVLVPLTHLAPPPTMVARMSFDCAYSKRRVNVAFATPEGSDAPSDVPACSLLTDERGIRCKKGCLRLVRTAWKPSPMVPRHALLADGLALRDAA